MFEVVTVSDLMVFVCPCGERCLTENGYDTHLESSHKLTTHTHLSRLSLLQKPTLTIQNTLTTECDPFVAKT